MALPVFTLNYRPNSIMRSFKVKKTISYGELHQLALAFLHDEIHNNQELIAVRKTDDNQRVVIRFPSEKTDSSLVFPIFQNKDTLFLLSRYNERTIVAEDTLFWHSIFIRASNFELIEVHAIPGLTLGQVFHDLSLELPEHLLVFTKCEDLPDGFLIY